MCTSLDSSEYNWIRHSLSFGGFKPVNSQSHATTDPNVKFAGRSSLCSLISVFIVYAPKLWGALLTSAILSLVVSASLKKLFAVPRPAAMFDTDCFVIIGRTLSGRTALPSGHSIAAFVVITILLFAFMPKKNNYKPEFDLRI